VTLRRPRDSHRWSPCRVCHAVVARHECWEASSVDPAYRRGVVCQRCQERRDRIMAVVRNHPTDPMR
jgi:hypothetical protein